MKARCVALLGRRDEPTDAVEEYCQFLGAALEAQGISFEIERVSWHELGWRQALAGMEQRTENWKKGWVLIQYTALAWSRPGFRSASSTPVPPLLNNPVNGGGEF